VLLLAFLKKYIYLLLSFCVSILLLQCSRSYSLSPSLSYALSFSLTHTHTHTNTQYAPSPKQVRESGPLQQGDEDTPASTNSTTTTSSSSIPDPADGPQGRGPLRKAHTLSIPSLRAGGGGGGGRDQAAGGQAAGGAEPIAYLLKTAEEYARDTRTPVVHSKRYFKHKRLPVRLCSFVCFVDGGWVWGRGGGGDG
jgi:hypothetical protein